jgi:hypothetical protein
LVRDPFGGSRLFSESFRGFAHFTSTLGVFDCSNSLGHIHHQSPVPAFLWFTAKIHGTNHRPSLMALLARRPTKGAAIALANKIANGVGQMAKGEHYREPIALAR